MGELMVFQAVKKGLAGIVIDGALRDLDSLRKMDIAIYSAVVTPKGPYKNGPGEINVPVCCGGVVVNPGDILIGDADGIVVISLKDARWYSKFNVISYGSRWKIPSVCARAGL